VTVRNIKTREGYDFWDKLCAIPRYGFIHSADNSRILKAEGIGNWIEMHSAQEVVDAAQDEINGLRAERDQLRVERDGANERAGLLLKAKNEWADRARAAEEEAGQIRAAISRPETVFIGMKRGTIAKPSLRSMIDLYGEVPNGEEQQLLEIAQLRAEVEALRKDAERLDFMIDERAVIQELLALDGPRFTLAWTESGEFQKHVYGTPREAIDAAMAAKEG